VKRVRKKFAARYKQVPVVIENAEMYKCAPCGEEFFTAEQSRELSPAAWSSNSCQVHSVEGADAVI